MKFTIAVMVTLFSMHGLGALIFSIMMLAVVGIVDIYHHKTMIDLRVKRFISDIEGDCKNTKFTVVKYDI
ncbi:hypothetical protein [Klebsiella phage pKP-BS317-1.1]|nr:hypothetical protein [Klebsiella phage pKP-BS317-1.1]